MFYQYNDTMLQQMELKTKGIEKLTSSELSKLKRLVIRHGSKKEFADGAGINYRTLGRIVLAGSGEKENIEKVRRQLEATK